MTGTLAHLALAAVAFVGGHFLLSGRRLRDPLVARLGERGFRAVYSAMAALTLAWLILAFRAAPPMELWVVPTGLRHLPMGVMLVAVALAVAGLATRNPTMVGGEDPELVAAGPRGIVKVTRHPFLWGVGLWGLAHMSASGDAARLLLFGAFTVLAFGGTAHIDARKGRTLGEPWDAYARASSNVPLAAIFAGRARVTLAEIGYWRLALGIAVYAGLLFLHEPVIGLPALPV